MEIVIKFDRSKIENTVIPFPPYLIVPTIFVKIQSFPPIIVKRGYTFFKKDTNMFYRISIHDEV